MTETCNFCHGKCDDQCMTTYAEAEGLYVLKAPSGVWVISETPYTTEDDWFRWGHLSFAFESYRMWFGKLRDAFRKKPVPNAVQDEQAQGKVGTL